MIKKLLLSKIPIDAEKLLQLCTMVMSPCNKKKDDRKVIKHNNNNFGTTRYLAIALAFFVLSAVNVIVVPTASFSEELTKYDPPLKQTKAGTPFYDVRCNDSLSLVLRPLTDSPICVTQDTASKITQRIDWLVTIDNNDDSTQPNTTQTDTTATTEVASAAAPAAPTMGWGSEISLSNIPKLGENATLTLKSTHQWRDTFESEQYDAKLYIELSDGFEFVQGNFTKSDEGEDWKQYIKDIVVSPTLPEEFEDKITIRAVKEGQWFVSGSSGYSLGDALYIIVGKDESSLHNGSFPTKPTLGIGFSNSTVINTYPDYETMLRENPAAATTAAMQGYDPNSPIQRIFSSYEFEPQTPEERKWFHEQACLAGFFDDIIKSEPDEFGELCKRWK